MIVIPPKPKVPIESLRKISVNFPHVPPFCNPNNERRLSSVYVSLASVLFSSHPKPLILLRLPLVRCRCAAWERRFIIILLFFPLFALPSFVPKVFSTATGPTKTITAELCSTVRWWWENYVNEGHCVQTVFGHKQQPFVSRANDRKLAISMTIELLIGILRYNGFSMFSH